MILLQLLLVVVPEWSATQGYLYRFERADLNCPWVAVASPIAVSIGKNGMAWGRGMHDQQAGPVKKESDGKSPAGIFSLGLVFGDEAHQYCAKHMPFLLIDDDLECIDDPHSIHYNRFVRAKSEKNRDWGSSEKMKEIGFVYALGAVIQHNMDPVCPSMGSAIFMHIWRYPNHPTAGCTAMEEKDLIEIVSWLDEKKHPVLVQLPLEEYIRLKNQWQLPSVRDFFSRENNNRAPDYYYADSTPK
jgi:L,D-peptidoglycan transpeptidase YkuD (ErfK/YbiS/YcfS/YnhG family)